MAGNFDRTESNRKYYQKNKDKYRAWAAEWRRKNPEKVRATNHQQYLKRKARKENENRSD